MSTNPFTKARKRLWDGTDEDTHGYKERYICHALESALGYEDISYAKYKKASDIVNTRLTSEYASVESFLAEECKISLSLLTDFNVQSYRFLWLAELEKLWNQGVRE